MILESPSHLADPRVVSLISLLDDLRKGHIQVARFQRPLVWKVEQQLDLLRSIRDGLPIGSILLWATRSHNLACFEWIGRRRIGAPSTAPGAQRQYVLDGFQRLSTLYRALGEPDGDDPNAEADAVDRVFFFDLDKDDFVDRGESELAPPHLLPLSILLQRPKLMRWQREHEERWVEPSEALFMAFDRYKIPLIPLATEDLDTATHAFERINRGGTTVSRVHIAHALSWSKDFDLLARIKQSRETVLAPIGWGHLEDEDVIDTCALVLFGKAGGSSPDQVARELKKQPTVLDQAVHALRRTAEFLLRDQIQSPDLVPYSRQIVFLAAAFCRQPIWTEQAERLARAWLWLTTYAEVFGSISSRDKESREILETLFEAVDNGRLRLGDWWPHSWRKLPSRLDFREARARSFGLQLLWIRPQLPDGSVIQLPPRINLRWLSDAVVQLVPRNRLESAIAYVSPGNRFLVPPEHVEIARKALLTPGVQGKVDWLRSHNIVAEAAQQLAAGNLQRFIELREDEINRLEEDSVNKYLELAETPPDLGEDFLAELAAAERVFAPPRYVGVNMFVRNWRWASTTREITPHEKGNLLARMVKQGRVEEYWAGSTRAIRLVR